MCISMKSRLILAGDALLTMAFQVLSSAEAIEFDDHHAETWLKVIQRISRAAGCRGMVEGQMRDIAAENNTLSRLESRTVACSENRCFD